VSRPKKVLVTGGAGFIGSHLVDRLVAEGYGVRVLDDLSAGKLENITAHLKAGSVDFVKGDIRDSAVVAKILGSVDVVVHFAALTSVTFSVEHPDLTFNVNVAGTQNLINACVEHAVSKFVFASSCAVYGDPEFLPVNETCKSNPISPYAESKLLGERYCLGVDKRQVLKPVVLRFFNVYGPRQGLNDYSGVITRFIDRVRQNKPLTVYGDGSQTRDFVSVHDIVEAVLASMRSVNAHGQVFNIGSGKPTSINELAKTILELAGVDLEIRHEKIRAGDIKDSYADISKAKKVLGYMPRVSLRAGLEGLI
jgi:UDP-glucose 4-epimerase